MKSMLQTINDHGVVYQALAFICPGCALFSGSGLHLLPVNTTEHSPSWDWDRNLKYPTLYPSILTGRGTKNVCHSYLKEGVFQFLNDSTHALAGQSVEMVGLPDWFVEENDEV